MDEEIDAPKPSKLKQLLPLVGMLALGLGGGACAMMYLHAPGDVGEAEDEASAEADAQAEGETKGEGEEKAAGAGKPEAAKAEGEQAEGEKAGHAKAGAAGSTTTNLGSFTINLRGSGGGRILRLEVQVDADPEAAAAIEALTPRIRDSIIAAVSDYTWSELEGTDGKTRLKDELLARISGITDPVVVRSVYLTNFVVS